MENFAQLLLEVRTAHALSRQALAQRLGCAEEHIADWEDGRAVPDAEVLAQLCRTFDWDTNQLIFLINKGTATKNRRVRPGTGMIVAGLIYLSILPLLAEWKRYKELDIVGRAYECAATYLLEYPLNLLLAGAVVCLLAGIIILFWKKDTRP